MFVTFAKTYFDTQEALLEFGGVVWMDASIRFHSDPFPEYYDKVVENGGFLAFLQSNYWASIHIHPFVYWFFPTEATRHQKRKAFITSFFMMHLTEDIYWGIEHWFFLCPMEPRCIPTGAHRRMGTTTSRLCNDANFLNRREGPVTRGQCHGYDQPVLNVLVPNYFGYNSSEYFAPINKTQVSMQREATDQYSLKYCD